VVHFLGGFHDSAGGDIQSMTFDCRRRHLHRIVDVSIFAPSSGGDGMIIVRRVGSIFGIATIAHSRHVFIL
jgi:hypothetical protein